MERGKETKLDGESEKMREMVRGREGRRDGRAEEGKNYENRKIEKYWQKAGRKGRRVRVSLF